MVQLTFREFVRRSQNTHGNLYDYSESDYKNCNVKLIVICKKHGEFEIKPILHWNGKGCQKCKKNKIRNQKKNAQTNFIVTHNLLNGITQNTKKIAFIDKAKSLHKTRYDYSNLNYKDDYLPINIKCNLHGVFSEIPVLHLAGYGCVYCDIINKEQEFRIDELSKFLNSAYIMYKNKYKYDCIYFNTYFDPITIICPYHGEFHETPYNHLNGYACYECYDYIQEYVNLQ
jgi:hypothetical protein